jgi:D-alanyl-D-alanine-carboxypeptidase/D-alanyl-D-alanine-endopeptidase
MPRHCDLDPSMQLSLNRRKVCLGIAALGGLGGAALSAAPTQGVHKQSLTAGARDAGRVTVVVDPIGAHMVASGSSGVNDLALDGETVFEIGSITKVLTALLLADMVAHGEVAFEDPVAKYLPASVRLHERTRPITLLDLATYTSGLPNIPVNFTPDWSNPFADYTIDKLYQFLSDYVPTEEPGVHYQYANLGFGLLGIALARRAQKSYEHLLLERVCDPLHLNHTRITLSADMRQHMAQGHDMNFKPAQLWDMPALPGMGAVRSTAQDMMLLLQASMGIKETTLDADFARLLKTRKPTGYEGTEVGLGWFISANQTDEVVWKSGQTGGFYSCIAFSTRHKRGAIVLANGPSDVIFLAMNAINPDFHLNVTDSLFR